MTNTMHRFELLFHSFDQSMWIKEMEDLIPSGCIVDGNKDGTRHVYVFAPAKDVDLVRWSVEKFTQHLTQVLGSSVLVFETIGWGDTYGASPDGSGSWSH